jgi:uncharacterized protein YkwD
MRVMDARRACVSTWRSMNIHPRALRATIAIVACGVLFAWPATARADTVDLVNALRTDECRKPLSSAHALHADAALDRMARDVLAGGKVRDALARAGVRASRTAVIQIGGRMDESALLHSLARGHCKTITDPGLTAIGVARTEERTVLVLIASVIAPNLDDAAAVSRQVLQLVNEARARPRRCGTKRFAAAPALVPNEQLDAAAASHARDMALHGRLTHEGSDDSAPADRVTRAGYAWRAVGENVAAGQSSAQEAVASWLSSPGHCANIMNADYTEMGVAFASNAKMDFGTFWVQVLGDSRAR